ncbi:MAG: S8 family peptidase [Eubacteriales bacterium]|nr:S8 family peptidase [Eubacteriales bacterium]
MADQKIDNLLNLAMDSTEQEREKSWNLNVGYDEELRLWDVIVKYSGDESGLAGDGITVVPLLGGYAVVTLPESLLETYSERPQVEFIEKPKRLYFSDFQANTASCIRSVQDGSVLPGIGTGGLSGRGILMGIVDSGVDYRHPDFRNEDGTTRILRLWDQSAGADAGEQPDAERRNQTDSGTEARQGRVQARRPPQGYSMGVEYTEEMINAALALPPAEGYRIVPERDFSGHGTSVLGIAAGNGRASNGVNRGVAYESDIIAVKMGIPRENSFPRTTELMQGIDYLVRQALALGRPMVINLSFGNNYGSHRGDSLLETYIDNVSNMGRLVICAGTGNNGNDNLHTAGQVLGEETQEIELGVSPFEAVLNVQLWKAYADEMEVYLEHPAGTRIGPLYEEIGPQRYRAGDTEILIYYGKPGPFQITQEIYFDFIPRGAYVDSGVWKIILRGRSIREGEYYLWLPGGGVLNPNTGFFLPQAQGTLTIPSTAARVITVGAYDSRLNTYADFSGRGSVNLIYRKPDLAAPGVDITAPVPGGSYAPVTGTSFATPFVSGAAALLMEWGIVQGNDSFLYGEKVKAYLRRGANPLPAFGRYPNEEIGYGEDVIIRLH